MNTGDDWLGTAVVAPGDHQKLIAEYPMIASGKYIEYNFGELKFHDVYGQEHAAQFCIYMADLKTQGLAFCKDFNDLN